MRFDRYKVSNWVMLPDGCGLQKGDTVYVYRVKSCKRPAEVIRGIAGEACQDCELADLCRLRRNYTYREELPVQMEFNFSENYSE